MFNELYVIEEYKDGKWSLSYDDVGRVMAYVDSTQLEIEMSYMQNNFPDIQFSSTIFIREKI